jgi:hypothetical protein
MRSGSVEKTYASGQGGGVGGPAAGGAPSRRSAVVRVGVSGDTRDDGGVLIIAGVAVGEGGANGGGSAGEGGASGGGSAGEGGANGESCTGEVRANGESCAGEGKGGVGDVAGGGVGGSVVRAGEGGVVLRGERARASPSPPSLSSSASHRLLTAFLVCFAGGGKGFEENPGEYSGRTDSGSGCSGAACLNSAVGDFARVGVGEVAGGCSGSGNSDPRRRRRRRRRLARSAPMACDVA